MHEETAREDYGVILPSDSLLLYHAVKGDSVEDLEAGKTVGFYRSREIAEAAYKRALASVPEASEDWVLIKMDKDGWPVEMQDAESFAQLT